MDAPRVCAMATTGTVDISRNAANTISFRAPATGVPTSAPGNTVDFIFEFWSGVEPSLAGTFDLHTGNQANYHDCAICMLAVEYDAQDQPVKTYFQSAGSINLAEDPFTNRRMIAVLTGLQLEEVTLDDVDATSTPVAGGTCANFPMFNADHDRIPNAWSCLEGDYGSGGTCNCICGAPDPDCYANGATVAGCTAGTPACFNDACVAKPVNDQCADSTAAAYVVAVNGTPITATTAGADRDYSSGLEGMACAGYAQPGPDVVYSVTLAAGTAYTVTLSNLATDYDGGVSLVGPGATTLCDASPITTCVAGADDKGKGGAETFSFTPAAGQGGVYYLIVDGYSVNDGGTFTLAVTSP